MFLGRVIGNAVVTAKDPGLKGFPLLLVQPLDHHLRLKGQPIIVVDRVGVGPGETVILETSREASFRLRLPLVPTDCSIVAKVDSSNVQEPT
ncbi:MAG: EutN/CcmL family microcompartment protein [Candidatus Riflebacteria bacterium]|nr:EutN/CcmL family microcompartment protein [Candidatus Riflebacteria bacterium]